MSILRSVKPSGGEMAAAGVKIDGILAAWCWVSGEELLECATATRALEGSKFPGEHAAKLMDGQWDLATLDLHYKPYLPNMLAKMSLAEALVVLEVL